jgi:hypothetical protein
MYQIGMTVLTDRLDAPLLDALHLTPDGQSTDRVVAGVSSLTASVSALQAAAANVKNFISADIAAPIHNLLNLSTTAMNNVLAVVDPVHGLVTAEANQLIGVARDLAQVGANVFRTYNAIATIPDQIRFQVAAVANAFENAFCVLTNAFRSKRQYADYTGLYGASNCSSTVGGMPVSGLAGVNSFDAVLSPSLSAVAVSPAAQQQISILKIADPILTPMTMPTLISATNTVAGGVTFGG